MAGVQNKSIEKLVDGCRRGNKNDWSELIDRLTPIIFSACHKFGLSREESFDVFGKISLMLLENLGAIRDERQIYGYVLTASSREAGALKARDRKLREKIKQIGLNRYFFNPCDSNLPKLIQKDDLTILVRAFSALSKKCRTLLNLLFFDTDNASYKNIAKKLGMPVSSIGPTRGRCLGKLRLKMKEFGYEE
ncbi:MAG: sigma-70 family RNA polymerase sigma factor [candidate division Zixibacteria bacterium]